MYCTMKNTKEYKTDELASLTVCISPALCGKMIVMHSIIEESFVRLATLGISLAGVGAVSWAPYPHLIFTVCAYSTLYTHIIYMFTYMYIHAR